MPLTACSVAIIALAFLPLNLLLLGHAPEFDTAAVAACQSSLGIRFWPAIFIAVPVAAASRVFARRALGGPLRRLETTGKRPAAGEFPHTIRIRHGDDLEEIAGSLNEAPGKSDCGPQAGCDPPRRDPSNVQAVGPRLPWSSRCWGRVDSKS